MMLFKEVCVCGEGGGLPLLQINSATSGLQGFLSKEPNLVPEQVRTPAWLWFTVADYPAMSLIFGC